MVERTLSGSVAIVTDAGRGIGAAIARRFADAGSDQVLVARGGEQLEDVAASVRASGCSVLTVAADLTDPAIPDQLVEEAIDRFGRLDVLVNNDPAWLRRRGSRMRSMTKRGSTSSTRRRFTGSPASRMWPTLPYGSRRLRRATSRARSSSSMAVLRDPSSRTRRRT